jgi:hypothetical protein
LTPNQGYRFIKIERQIEIRTTDYHARPLRLDRKRLARLGTIPQ